MEEKKTDLKAVRTEPKQKWMELFSVFLKLQMLYVAVLYITYSTGEQTVFSSECRFFPFYITDPQAVMSSQSYD